MLAAVLELVIRQARNTVPVRVAVRAVLTTLGSSREADVVLPLLPAEWAVVQRRGGGVALRLVGGAEHVLAPGQHLELGEVSIALAERGGDGPLQVAAIAAALAGASGPDDALRLIVAGVLDALGADTGAAIVAEAGGWRVAVALDRRGEPIARAAELLSDTIVRDVLDRGGTVCVDDIAGDRRYAAIPSVVALALGSVICVPMAAGERVLGALYVGRRGVGAPFAPVHARELAVLAAMAVPLVAQLRRAPGAAGADGLVGEAPAIVEVRRLIERVAPSDLSVLIGGETGTGKEVAARAIHAASPRAARPMIALNCSAVPAGLLEAELFGHARGAFTGAVAERAGRIEAADGSTLFLDEIGDMPLAMQAALLRVLQERELTRVGESRPRPVDFRLIAASHKDLDAEVAAGRFREDLLYRIREVEVVLPPLRARGDDVVLLARLFLHQAERELSLPVHRLAASAEAALRGHAWPGNVRELRAVLRRAAVLCDGAELTAADVAIDRGRSAPPAAAPPPIDDLGDVSRPLAEARDAYVARYVAAVLDRYGGDRDAAAAALGISVRSLYRYLT
jgi:transcriptional regulator with GAF, ATPase, and Fis domain